MGKSIITTIARPSLPKIAAAPRWLNMTPESYLRGAVTAAVLPTPKTRRGRRVARKARKAAYKAAFAQARQAQRR